MTAERLPDSVEYVGFWARVAASLIDTVLVMVVITPLLLAVYGKAYFDISASSFVAGPADFLISWVLPAVAVVLFWIYRQATPGKMAVSARVVDAKPKAARDGTLIARHRRCLSPCAAGRRRFPRACRASPACAHRTRPRAGRARTG